MNEKFLFEMGDAQLKLAEAKQLASESKAKVAQSQQSFEEAIACSTNQNADCYQKVTADVRDGYQTINEAITKLEQAFANPIVQRMIHAATDNF
jgi:hypothetical protein